MLLPGILALVIAGHCLAYDKPKLLTKDPTSPTSYENIQITRVKNNDLGITAVFAGKDSQKVIINDHLFEIGDKVSDATITAIDINGITLKNDDGTEIKIPASYSNVKTPTTKNKKESRENLD